MKTVLHISKYYAPDMGGIETVAKYLAEGMTSFKNIIVCFSTNGKNSHDVINNIDVYRIKVNFKISSQDISFGYYRQLKRIIKAYQPDFINIHCPNPFVYPIAIRLAPKNCKICLLWHADILFKGLIYKAIKPIETAALKRADIILATSPNYIDDSSPIYKYRNKIQVVQNGIITNDFELNNEDKKNIENIKSKYSNKPIIIFVGRHVSYKGIDLLIEAEKYIKSDCVILIIGKGPETDNLKKLSTSKRIKFLGKITQDELKNYYHAADIFAFPSKTKAEAFGVALAEAMYCKCVPVTFTLKGSGVNWVNINGETGYEVALGDIQKFAQAIDEIISQPERRKEMADAARNRITTLFTEQISAQKANGIFLKL